VLTAAPGPQEPPEPPEPPGSSQDEASGQITLVAAGFGPDAARLAGDLAAHTRAWDQAGRPGVAGLRVDAYPKPARSPEPGRDALVIDRPSTRFVVSHA
jgi:protein-L-isoaspartate(D-aspartate) O-methyltransferase